MARPLKLVRPVICRFLPGLPKGLRFREAPDYVLSNTFAKSLGDDLPRRHVLIGMAAALSTIAIPRRTKAIPILVPVVIGGVALAEAMYHVFHKTTGSFTAKNDEDSQVHGYVNLSVVDENSNMVEGSSTARYSFPPDSSAQFNFWSGPHATTPGDKTLVVAAENSSDSDDFVATA